MFSERAIFKVRASSMLAMGSHPHMAEMDKATLLVDKRRIWCTGLAPFAKHQGGRRRLAGVPTVSIPGTPGEIDCV